MQGKYVVIYTSYFAFIPKLPNDILKISIALFTHKWAQIDGHCKFLKPNKTLLRKAKFGTISKDIVKQEYQTEILDKLSPANVYEKLIALQNKSKKKDIALLCYETPDKMCHRRFVAEWLEKHLHVHVQIPEYVPYDKQLQLVG